MGRPESLGPEVDGIFIGPLPEHVILPAVLLGEEWVVPKPESLAQQEAILALREKMTAEHARETGRNLPRRTILADN